MLTTEAPWYNWQGTLSFSRQLTSEWGLPALINNPTNTTFFPCLSKISQGLRRLYRGLKRVQGSVVPAMAQGRSWYHCGWRHVKKTSLNFPAPPLLPWNSGNSTGGPSRARYPERSSMAPQAVWWMTVQNINLGSLNPLLKHFTTFLPSLFVFFFQWTGLRGRGSPQCQLMDQVRVQDHKAQGRLCLPPGKENQRHQHNSISS